MAMQVFLEAGDVDVEAKDFRRERMLASKFLGAMDAPLPGGDRHWAIINSR